MKIIEKLLLFFSRAQFVCDDYYGNSYYVFKQKDSFGRNVRYVKYFKKMDASSIPPLWSAWLRYSIDTEQLKSEIGKDKASFVKPHLPDLTGTNECYLPTNGLKKTSESEAKIYNSWLD